jgi:alpha-mannosidase
VKFRFSVPSEYVDALRAEIDAGRANPREYSGDTAYSWSSFWLNMPEVRQFYRRDEHLLQSAEALSTAASLAGGAAYPSQDFYHSWINMLMNMDRNVIWGAAVGVVFKDPRHWDAWDRFESVERQAQGAAESAARALAGKGAAVTLYNPLNWKRSDPVRLPRAVEGVPCQALAEDVVCRPELVSAGIASFRPQEAKAGSNAPLPGTIETPYYTARVDAGTGALTSLKVKPSGEELLGGPANVMVADTAAPGEKSDPVHFMDKREKRKRLGTSSDYPSAIRVTRGPVATQVIATSDFHGGSKLVRTITFYDGHPRIDLDTRLDLKADNVFVSADFPLAGDAVETSRGIPYGFSTGGSGIQPAVRWSNCQLASGTGLAVLDRGLTGREVSGRTMVLGLVNAVSEYLKRPNELLRAQGVREYHYALVPHAGSWQKAGIPRLAWEFNAPPLWVAGTGRVKPQSWLETSANVIVEAVRRVGSQIEIRLVETNGEAGTAEIAVRLPHRGAAITDMMGEHGKPLAAGTPYRFPIRAQQIVTLRLDTAATAPAVAAIRDWSPLVPPAKRQALGERNLKVGHPGF